MPIRSAKLLQDVYPADIKAKPHRFDFRLQRDLDSDSSVANYQSMCVWIDQCEEPLFRKALI